MDLKDIKKLMEYMDEHELGHLEVVRGDDSVTLQKIGADAASAPAPYPVAMAPAPAAAAGEGAAPKDGEDSVNDDGSPKTYIDSPTPGTFYRSPDPDQPAFVKVGDVVEEDTTVCIIEAMKVMNELKAERRGTIVEILVDDAKPVQYGTHLFVIDPS